MNPFSTTYNSSNSTLLRLSKVLCFILITFNLCYAEEYAARITGKVIDLTNDGLVSYTKIKLESVEGSGTYKAETSSDLIGNFEFKSVPAGTYKISTVRLGYEKEELNGITVTANEVKNINIFLTPVNIETDKINVTAT
ncbi:MAG TPA: hypothetical protein DCX92_01280, partial [Bacteroidetes bacterium]|nr:hypothetical protein [Bacteroidota bacterium]